MPRVMSGAVARQRLSSSWRSCPISGSVRQGARWACPVALFRAGVAKIPSRDEPCRLSLFLCTSSTLSLWCACSSLLPSSIRMGFFLCLRSYRIQDDLAALRVDHDRIALANSAIENAMSDTVLDLPLDDALEGTSPELRVEAHLCQQVPCGVSNLQRDVPLFQARAQAIDLDIHNVLHLLTRDLMEDDDLIDAVDELRAEALFPQALTDLALDLVLIHTIELVQPARSDVTGHNDDRVPEIDCAALPVRQATVIEQLQQDVEYFWRRFFDFVEEDDAVGPAAHGLGQLASLFVADVAGRRPDQARDAVLLHVLRHINTNQGPLIVKEEFGQGACQFRFPNTGWSQEHEAGQG